MEGLSKALEVLRLLGGKGPQRILATMEAMKTRLASQRVTGIAGGGLVRVTMTAARNCVSVEIDPSLRQVAIQDLVRVAVNDALSRVTEIEAREQVVAAKDALSELPAIFRDVAGDSKAGFGPGTPRGEPLR